MLTQSTIDTIREELDEKLDRDRVTISNWDEQKRYVPLNKFQEKHYIATRAKVEAIEAALRELAELQADAGGVAGGLPMPDGVGWIPVDKSLPEKHTWVLVYADGAINCAGYTPGEGFEDWTLQQAPNIVIQEITHWRHLPTDPITLPWEQARPQPTQEQDAR